MLRLPMSLRSTNRKKDGKNHRYFSLVENRRLPGDKAVLRTVLYLGEICIWTRSIIGNKPRGARHWMYSMKTDNVTPA